MSLCLPSLFASICPVHWDQTPFPQEPTSAPLTLPPTSIAAHHFCGKCPSSRGTYILCKNHSSRIRRSVPNSKQEVLSLSFCLYHSTIGSCRDFFTFPQIQEDLCMWMDNFFFGTLNHGICLHLLLRHSIPPINSLSVKFTRPWTASEYWTTIFELTHFCNFRSTNVFDNFILFWMVNVIGKLIDALLEFLSIVKARTPLSSLPFSFQNPTKRFLNDKKKRNCVILFVLQKNPLEDQYHRKLSRKDSGRCPPL